MNSEYLPPFEVLKAGLAVSSDGDVISMSRDLFAMLVRAAVAADFDPVWYRTANPDIVAAIEDGSIADELEHFCRMGYQEGRNPIYFAIDNEWYLSNYPDVSEAIGDHGYVDAEAHFNEAGYGEGRAADAMMMAQIEAWQHAISESRSKLEGVARREKSGTNDDEGLHL